MRMLDSLTNLSSPCQEFCLEFCLRASGRRRRVAAAGVVLRHEAVQARLGGIVRRGVPVNEMYGQKFSKM